MSSSSYYGTTKALLSNFVQAFKPSPPLERQVEILEKMEDGKLYVENVRQFFGITRSNAEFLCEQAVNEGIFDKQVGYLCGNQNCRRIIHASRNPSISDATVICEACEALEKDNHKFAIEALDSLTFYTFLRK